MDSNAAFDKIIQNLEFEVKAVQEENIEPFRGVDNTTPLNVKIRVRKRDETGVLHPGFISVPKFVQSNKMPKKIRLVNSDQTIVSFNLLMESDQGQNHIAPSKRKHLFGVFKSGGCLDPKNDDNDEYSYMPSASTRNPKTNSIVINTSNYKLKMNSNGKKISEGNVSNEPKKTKRQKRFFGYCKPGGCLDPPFNEDQYSYKPSYLKQTTIPVKKSSLLGRETKKNQNLDLIDDNKMMKLKKIIKESSWMVSEQEKVDSKTIINIFHTDSMKISLDTAYSNSIITYPPTLSSSELYLSEKRSGNNAKNADLSVKKVSNPSNEYNDTFFVPPKKNSIGNKTREIVGVLRDPTGLDVRGVPSQVSKEKNNNANNDTIINKEETNETQNQHLSLRRSDTIQSNFDKLDLVNRETPRSTRRHSEKLQNNSYEFKKIPTKIISSKPCFTQKIRPRSSQDISVGDIEVISDTKSSDDVSKNKFDIHNEIKCSQLDQNLGFDLQIEKRSKSSASRIGRGLTDSFTKTNIMEKTDSDESINAINPLTDNKNEELNPSSFFDSIAFKNDQCLYTTSTNFTETNFLVSNSDIRKELKNQDEILSSDDITMNEKQSYSFKNHNRVDDEPKLNSDGINFQINHHNKVIANESNIKSDIPDDFIFLVLKNKSDYSIIKEIVPDSSKANLSSSDDSKKLKDFDSIQFNAYIGKERKSHDSCDSNNYLSKSKTQLTNLSRPNLLDSVTLNYIPSMETLYTRTKNTTGYIEKESKCKERKSHASTDSNDYLTKRHLTNSSRDDSPNLLDTVTLNENPSMEPLSTQITHKTESTTCYIEKESTCKERKSENSTDSNNYLTKRQFINKSLTGSPNLLDSVALNGSPSMEPLSIILSDNISTENTNAYKELKIKDIMTHKPTHSHDLTKSDKHVSNSSHTNSPNLLDSVIFNDISSTETLSLIQPHNMLIQNMNSYVEEKDIKEQISHNSNNGLNYLNMSDTQLTSSSRTDGLTLLDSVILNESPPIEHLSIPIPHNILTENRSNDIFKESRHLLTKNESDELSEQRKINVIKHQNLTISNSLSNLSNHDEDANIIKKNEYRELKTKQYNLKKSINDNRLENNKLHDISPENKSEVFKLISNFKVHENDFNKSSENLLTTNYLKKIDSHESLDKSIKFLEINKKNLNFGNLHQYNIDHLYPDTNIENSRSNTDSSMPKFIEESPNVKPNNINSQPKLLLYTNEKSKNKTLQAMDANPKIDDIIEIPSKSVNSDPQFCEKLLSPTSPSYTFNIEPVKNHSDELLEKPLDNYIKGESTQIENSIRKTGSINGDQDQTFATILPEGDRLNNISKTETNLISESLHDSFNRSGKSISSYTKIIKNMERNEILANSKTNTKYDPAGIDSTIKVLKQSSHSFQSEKSQNTVFYNSALNSLKENDNDNIPNKDGVYVKTTLVGDTASIKYAVIKHSEILSKKRVTGDILIDSEPLLPKKNIIRRESSRELSEKSAISHHNLLNLISKESAKNSDPDPNFASKSTIKPEIVLDLGFQSYYNYAKNQRVMKSLDTSIVNVRYPHDAVTVIKSANLLDNEIKISVDSEMDMCIQILHKNKIKFDKHQKVNNNIQDIKSISNKKPINEDKNNTKDNCVVDDDVAQSYEIAIENTLKSVYEQQLIPLQDMIRNLKKEIDSLAGQQSEVRGTVFKNNLYPTNRTRSARLIQNNKRCKCLKK